MRVLSLFLILFSFGSNSLLLLLPLAANAELPENHTSYSNMWNPSPTHHSPWQPPEGFYSHFDPSVADLIRKRVQDLLVEWRNRELPPLYQCRYSCEQYSLREVWPEMAHRNPTPQHEQQNPIPVDNSQTTPPPPNCPTMKKVLQTCTLMERHDVVDYAYSWSCTYSDDCCKETLNVHDECLNLNPSITWLKTICCTNSTTPATDEANA